MGIMNQTVQDGIGQCGIRNAVMPIGNGNLAGDQGGRMSEAIIQDFKNILRVLDGEGIAHPVIEHEQIDACQRTQQVRS